MVMMETGPNEKRVFKKQKVFATVCLMFLGMSIPCFAQETIQLYPEGKIPNDKQVDIQEMETTLPFEGEVRRFITQITDPELTVYLPNADVEPTGIGVIICPGGGYFGLAIDHEGHYIAQKFNEKGIAAFVLKSRMPSDKTVLNKEIVPLQDAQRAIQLVRENAETWGLDVDKIGILGSSAGGHLAATLGTHYDKVVIENPNGTSFRPDFMVLNYPVISFEDSRTHMGSRFNLIGHLPEDQMAQIMADRATAGVKLAKVPVDKELIMEYSNELQVTPDTPPTFISHAVDDDVVNVDNSLVFIAALQQNNVPVKSFFYAKGGHGFGMYNPNAKINWIDVCPDWVISLFKI